MEDALKLIIAKSEDAMQEAVRTLQAINANSPVVQQRYNHVVEIALADPYAMFTPEERAIIAAPLATSESETRDYTLRIRVSEYERGMLERLADEAGVTMSEYVRSKVFE